MKIIGVTGSLGTGKTTVARMFLKRGCKVIDADRLAHRVIKKGTPQYRRILGEFGQSILKADAEIDRHRLAKLAFSQKANLKKLNRIIHPAVIKQIKQEIAAAKRARCCAVIDAPLLIESGFHRAMEVLIVVSASRENQIKRVKKDSGMPREMILQIIGSQFPLSKKKKLADFIIDNNGSLKETKRQVDEIWLKLSRLTRCGKILCR
ncbi:MAG: dephospho-CoA kinase [Candidatus Omnitrophota bacterium]